MSLNFAIDGIDSISYEYIGDYLYKILNPIAKDNQTIIFLCIGSDRSTGDSLGPLIGHNLKSIKEKNIYILGSLEKPVHSQNLQATLDKINSYFINPYIVAIDASLGSIQNIGKIFIENKPLFPGLALNKELPPVGNLSIKGIVNISGKSDFIVLQNTRLYTVMSLADNIYKGIIYCVKKIKHDRANILNNKNLS